MIYIHRIDRPIDGVAERRPHLINQRGKEKRPHKQAHDADSYTPGLGTRAVRPHSGDVREQRVGPVRRARVPWGHMLPDLRQLHLRQPFLLAVSAKGSLSQPGIWPVRWVRPRTAPTAMGQGAPPPDVLPRFLRLLLPVSCRRPKSPAPCPTHCALRHDPGMQCRIQLCT